MIDIKEKCTCCGCGACSQVCPMHCIEMMPDKEGFLYPVVDDNSCINCGLCEKVCPELVDNAIDAALQDAWGVVTKNKQILLNSSSGGAFTELSLQVLEKGGCVFGASFSDDFKRVRHIMVESIEELHKLQGSKYVQSESGKCFQEVKAQLKKGREVLFSGTPCQIAGLKGYLNADYENLLLVDVICHGTPSPQLWESYLNCIEKKNTRKVRYVNFRYKKNECHQLNIGGVSQRRKIYYRSFRDAPYMKIYLKNYCLRESCYACKFKGNKTVSDITIGDFWGVQNIEPDMDNEQGVSLVIVHTQKGKNILQTVSEKIKNRHTEYEEALIFNPSLGNSVKRPMERDSFYDELSTYGWKWIEKKYANMKILGRIKKLVKTSVVGPLVLRVLKKDVQLKKKSRFSYGMIIVLE